MKALFPVVMGFTLVMSFAVSAHESEGYEQIVATPIEIKERSKTVIGQDYRYPSGEPVLLAYRIVVKPGQKTSWHKHSVPLFAYVMSGVLEVDYGSKGVKKFEKGTGFVEAIDWCHQGIGLGDEDVVVLGLYLAKDSPDSAKPVICNGPQ
ncbi:MAG TPA: hypothetical protein DHW07_00960 [Gammaproteobacteria bacterium]|nr:hypothetical protein [Gammaproteobacteria bacterium]|tara:strand:+ start:589 stop:1038 length:450 start_codon:yes stop_codon:yes gene_type:complete